MAPLTASGAYLLSGHDGPYAVERFTCGTDGDTWRYDAVREDPGTAARTGRLELHLRDAGTRLHVEAGGWVLRGAAAAGQALWRRGGPERTGTADGFTGTSPAFLVVAARLGGGSLRLVEVTEPVLATRTALQRWVRLAGEVHDGLALDVWQVDHVATGERAVVRLAGDVVVQAPGVRLLGLTRP